MRRTSETPALDGPERTPHVALAHSNCAGFEQSFSARETQMLTRRAKYLPVALIPGTISDRFLGAAMSVIRPQ